MMCFFCYLNTVGFYPYLLSYIHIYFHISTDRLFRSIRTYQILEAGIETGLTVTPIQDSTTQLQGNQRKGRKFKRLCITFVFVYIYPLNGYRELDSYEEPCFMLGATITSFARELNPIYIYISGYSPETMCLEYSYIEYWKIFIWLQMHAWSMGISI